MALTALRPDMTRAHLLRAAARQFPEGDVQHWWLPHSGQGVRTRISDDRVWLGYAPRTMSQVSGDAASWTNRCRSSKARPFCPARMTTSSSPVSTMRGQPVRALRPRLDQAIALTGANGMPLIGTGDWNDGMNRVGEGGKAQRLAGLAADRHHRAMAPHGRPATRPAPPAGAPMRGGGKRPSSARAGTAPGIGAAPMTMARRWGRPARRNAGSTASRNPGRCCRGRPIPTARLRPWPRCPQHLSAPIPGLALLFTPPFDKTPQDPGYIKGYPPGLRENGGQYSHAAMWAILAHAGWATGTARRAVRAAEPDQPRPDPRCRSATRWNPMSSPPMSIPPPARRARRLDLVHRLGRHGCIARASRASGGKLHAAFLARLAGRSDPTRLFRGDVSLV
jgi:cyclic beta-1,2-glucan synthetase